MIFIKTPSMTHESGCSETRFLGSRPRPRLCFFESQWRDETETFFLLSLNIETRPRLFFSESQCRDETETFFLLSLNVETRPRLFFQSLNIETRPRLFFSESQYRDEITLNHFSGGGEGTKSLIWSLFRVYQGCWTSFEGIFCKKLENKNLGSWSL